jgi:hypothetical protein
MENTKDWKSIEVMPAWLKTSKTSGKDYYWGKMNLATVQKEIAKGNTEIEIIGFINSPQEGKNQPNLTFYVSEPSDPSRRPAVAAAETSDSDSDSDAFI